MFVESCVDGSAIKSTYVEGVVIDMSWVIILFLCIILIQSVVLIRTNSMLNKALNKYEEAEYDKVQLGIKNLSLEADVSRLKKELNERK